MPLGALVVLFLGLSLQLSNVTSEYVGRPVTVECEPSIHGGYAGGDEAVIDSTYCNPLHALLGRQRVAPVRQGVGLIVLTHEALHLKGVLGEARAECYAFQQVDEMQRLFGVDPRSWWGRKIRSYAYLDHLQILRDLPRYRDDVSCRQDGLWDLTPGDGVWP